MFELFKKNNGKQSAKWIITPPHWYNFFYVYTIILNIALIIFCWHYFISISISILLLMFISNLDCSKKYVSLFDLFENNQNKQLRSKQNNISILTNAKRKGDFLILNAYIFVFTSWKGWLYTIYRIVYETRVLYK